MGSVYLVNCRAAFIKFEKKSITMSININIHILLKYKKQKCFSTVNIQLDEIQTFWHFIVVMETHYLKEVKYIYFLSNKEQQIQNTIFWTMQDIFMKKFIVRCKMFQSQIYFEFLSIFVKIPYFMN